MFTQIHIFMIATNDMEPKQTFASAVTNYSRYYTLDVLYIFAYQMHPGPVNKQIVYVYANLYFPVSVILRRILRVICALALAHFLLAWQLSACGFCQYHLMTKSAVP